MVRRKGASANVEETNGPDLHTSRSIGDAGLVRPPAEMRHDGGGGMNLEQVISLLKPEREAYIEFQNQAFADIAGLRSHLQAEEQQCRGKFTQHLNMKYQSDMQEENSVIVGLE